MRRAPAFKPFPLLTSCHTQTILGTVLTFNSEPPSIQKIIDLPDGDKLSIEVTTPQSWKPTDQTVVMIHGLCGSHRSAYLIRMTKRLSRLGIRSIRVNLRGCGSGKGLAKKIYHSGCSSDIQIVLEKLIEENPHSLITLIGFSLGGNIALKLAGELCMNNRKLIQKVIGVSPPIDLSTSVVRLDDEKNKLYARYFMRYLLSDVEYRHKVFADLPKVEFPNPLTFYLFDKHYTIPQVGYETNEEYYTKSSALFYIPEISIPCHILFAEDDPIIDSTVVNSVTLPDNVDIITTKYGGHMGFLASPLESSGFHWMDAQLIEWILNR